MIYFWLIFKMSKIQNVCFVGNLFLYSRRNFYNNDIIIVTSPVLKTQSPCEIFSRRCCSTIMPRSYQKNEHVKQIRVKFCLFKTLNVNSFGIVDSFFNIFQVYLNICPILQRVCECLMQKKPSRLLRKPLTNDPLHLHI